MEIFLTICFVITLAVCYFYWRRKFLHLQEKLDFLNRQKEKLESGLAESMETEKSRQKAFVNSMSEGILILDENSRIQLANNSLMAFFSLNGSITGLSMIEVFRRHELPALVRQAASEHFPDAIQIEVPTIPPKILEVKANAVLDAQGKLQGTVLVFHDLTRIQELENMRKEFVANVSHELRTPLSLIKGFVETLLAGAKDDPDACIRFLQIIEKHANRLTFLIEDLLSLSQLESGKAAFNFQTAQLRPIVDEIIDDLSSSIQQRQITLLNQIAPDIAANIDNDRMQQVFFNLVDNAIKYGKNGGVIQIGASQDGSNIKVWVQDNGPGIPPDSVERIFERFYRMDRARSRDQGGTGLGLAIVKHIVLAHRGKVWVESKQGDGAKFVFILPIESIS